MKKTQHPRYRVRINVPWAPFYKGDVITLDHGNKKNGFYSVDGAGKVLHTEDWLKEYPEVFRKMRTQKCKKRVHEVA